MNRSRLSSLRRRAMPRRERSTAPCIVPIVEKDGGYYLAEDPSTRFGSTDELANAWRARHEDKKDASLIISTYVPEKGGIGFGT